MSLEVIGLVSGAITSIADRFFPDPNKAQEFKLKLQEIEQSGELAKYLADNDIMKGQMEINKIEAASSNLFVQGWRPFIGWICGCILLLVTLVMCFQWLKTGIQPDLDFIWTIMGSLLGIGTLRTVEKVKGVASSSVTSAIINKLKGK